MNFTELDDQVQQDIVDLLSGHVAGVADILREDRCLIPMLRIEGTSEESPQLISLQAKDGTTDVDKAYAAAVRRLKETDFTYALFSYSTQIGLKNGGVKDALKNFVFTKDGICIIFYTPFSVGGLFRKKVSYEKTMLSDVMENVF